MVTEIFMVVKSMKAKRIRIAPAALLRRDQLVVDQKCLGCEKRQSGKTYRRGLCDACYGAVQRALAGGRVTEEELLKQGRILQPRRGGRPPTNDFTRELGGS